MATKSQKPLAKTTKRLATAKARNPRTPARPSPPPSSLAAELRKSIGINRKLFARLTGYSERALAQWESGTKPSGASLQKMTEAQRLYQALANVMDPEFVGHWLQQPNKVLGGLKPIEVVERGEVDRIWQMVFELGSGMPG